MPLVPQTVDGIIVGEPGLSAYEVALSAGFIGSEQEWLDSLVGRQGDPGPEGEPGPEGDPGGIGDDGLSAYDIAVENGYTGTEAEWVDSLKATLPSSGAVGDVITQTSGGPVWTALTRILVLDAGEPVPTGTLPQTVILRRE